ncbi:hypothetical protein [Streptomyces sp. YIM 98790]|uniref:hypothetical protein n=1 Tax=Streptomyces sp. YIM 98790 TaxID=2689077 RepID=UPI001408C43B|nr:hypothetical protein [Streptomyces sp. YIM 98790]
MSRGTLRKSGILAGVLGAVTAAMTTAAPPVTADAGAARQPQVVRCELVRADLPDVAGFNCDSTVQGPIEDFIIQGPVSVQRFHCAVGFASPLLVIGQECVEDSALDG